MAKKEYLSFIKTLAIALILAGFIRSFFFEPFHIPSGSMKPNLLVGDYIIVTKYSYGYSRYSFPFGFNFFSGRIFQSEKNMPQRGDIAVFRYPSDPSVNYIKRIIGLPGDIIQMRDGILYVNDKMISKIPDGKFIDYSEEGLPVEIDSYIETFFNGKKIKTLDIYKNAPQDNTGLYLVPQGHFFMMGDNRDNSQDSRFLSQVGFVPAENLIGKARFIFFSTANAPWKFWLLPSSIRFERIFKKVD